MDGQQCDEDYCLENIRYLFVYEIVDMNQQVLALTPGEPFGLLKPEQLQSVVMRPKQVSYYEQSEDVFLMAAAYGDALTNWHIFANANKRTAAHAVYVFLKINGFLLQAPQNEIKEIYEGLAIGIYDMHDLSDWLYQWCVPHDASQLND
ncbi:death-on-curing family protein [Kushneria pakistanensis]|uniref:Death-on-curing family protein n=1 Tax=Kushneria pakistanensis TaxID=1508770 RepID=A0ABQ3FBR6_9GAMM|nr:type II toxin-antitoxin system death-on-curing family toxin [Kushneria pakistanensis]GHC17511.1 death-on-curing family protein [Kushneria pakistanensis]